MRINTNISALNAHRQLGANQTNGARSLERLSSGLRINRAGDDAAGLAISEKMRAQIRGLNQAAKNSQDGISMIQTAEGNLSETHSILQRMRELADQAANDTNVGVDRNEIQKEINALTTEINRIGNTTEFNTQKLLNGGGEVKEIAINTMQKGAASGALRGGTALTAADNKAATHSVEVANGAIVKIDFGAENEAKANGIKVVYAASENNVAATAAYDSSGNTITITLGTEAANNDAAAIQSALQGLTSDLDAIGVDAAKITVTGNAGAVADDDALTAEAKTASEASGGVEIKAGSSSVPITGIKTSTAAVAAQWTSGVLEVLGDGSSGEISFAGVDIKITAENNAQEGISGANQVGANLVIDSTTTAADQAQLIVDAFNAVKAQQPSTGSLANFTFEASGTGEIIITGTKEDGAKNNAFKLTSTGDIKDASDVLAVAPGTPGVTEVRGEYSFEIETAFEKAGATLNIAGQEFVSVASGAKAANGEFNVNTDAKQQAINLAAAINANGNLNTRFDAIVDGAKITLREKLGEATGTSVGNGLVVGPTNDAVQGRYSFNVDEPVAIGGRYNVAGVNIEVTDDADHAGLAGGTAVIYSSDTTQQATNLANAIAANAALSENYEVEAFSNRITLTQKTGKESMVDAKAQTGTNKYENFQSTFQVGANSGQSMTIEVDDMRSVALGVSGEKEGADVVAGNGVKAKYTHNTNVSNGTDNINVEYALDVSDHDKATAAISVINDAIETVSAERSKLGAYQNRLEHTITNLGTSSENLAAAESRIRDLDMADEMMEFTKNNILQQAATAMLAQANMAPQTVLQLLG